MSSTRRILERLDSRIYRTVGRIYSNITARKTTVAFLVVLAIVLGVLIRTRPFGLNGYEFYEFDSYIEYWQANYVYEKGPLAWYNLTRENPDTHIFWYPVGRDFTTTSYPFFPLWIGLTYHIVQYTGLTLHDWAALQPILFAIIATILAYFAAKEVFESRIAGIVASYLFAVLPAAIERTVIGYVEKEGAAAVFIFLFVYFYAKTLRKIRTTGTGWIKYDILAALSLALVGWLWGGYVFILGTVVAFTILAPLLLGRVLSKELVVANVLLVVLSIVFEIPSPANMSTLGFYPPRVKSLGLFLVLASLIPVAYYYLSREYRRLGFRKPVLTQRVYFGLIVLVVIAGVVLSAMGFLPIGGRLAWALGLRFMYVTPLVESIAEHQSPLSSTGMFIDMLQSWGAILYPLVFASPLALAIASIFYMIYKGEPEKVYLAVAFAVAFYSYLNAVYMIAAASYFGVLASAIMITVLFKYAFPYEYEVVEARRKTRGRSLPGIKRVGIAMRIFALLLVISFIANTAYTAYTEYTTYSNAVYTFKAGVSNIPYYSDSWYKAVEVMKNEMPKDALVISWWDYGYGISVPGGKISAADGSTINETQIGIIGLILTSSSTENASQLAKLLEAKPNKTYIMVIEGVVVSETNNTITILPPLLGGAMPGLVDWPKSIWMIRIGNGVVDELRKKGINVSYVNTDQFFRVYNVFEGIIAPKLDDYNNLPLIYKIVVDAALYWASEYRNKTGVFLWFTGSESPLDTAIINYISTQLKLNVTLSISVDNITSLTTRPLANDTYLKPYRVVMEPFINPRTHEPLRLTYTLGANVYEGVLYSLIVFYELSIPETQ